MLKRILFILCPLLFALYIPVFPQEIVNNNEQNNDLTDETIYVINSFDFIVDGYTRAYALIYNAELVKGEEITGLSNLNKFIREKQQLLYNQRVLESVRVEHTIGDELPDGKYPVDLVFYVKDTWNIMAIPRPQYSTNSGFDITIKARHYNFLGTMNSLRVDLGYGYDQDGYHSISAMIDTDIPFRFLGLNWTFGFYNSYDYRPNKDLSHYYRNKTGLSVELPFRRTTFDIGFTETFIVNEENSSTYWKEYGEFQKGFYMTSNVYVSWKIPTGLSYYDLSEVNYTPRISATFVHEFSKWPIDDFRKGPSLNFSHSLSFSRINWDGNFQTGASASISNSVNFNFHSLKKDEQPWDTNISISGTGHKKITDFFGISSRIMYRHYFLEGNNDNAGDALRGVRDNSVTANYMLSLNFDLNFRVFKFRPSVWSNNHRFWRIFDFDFHMIPIVDFAFYNNPIDQDVFGLENLLLTCGMEAIIFPVRWRSLFLRVSFALNLSPGEKSSRYEIFIGTELHY